MSAPPTPAESTMLHSFFAKVARRYDLLNRIMTLGLDEWWRARAVAECLRHSPRRMLDLCCGTGDLLVRATREARVGTRLVGADFSREMLAVASHKLERAALRHRAELVVADAAALPFPDAHFDSLGIAFGFRNLVYKNPNRIRHLAEMRRVLAPKGRLVIVETSQPSLGVIRALSHLYIRAVVPVASWALSGDEDAYGYLASSAVDFHTPAEIAAMLKEAGFAQITQRPLLFGAAALHVATGLSS